MGVQSYCDHSAAVVGKQRRRHANGRACLCSSETCTKQAADHGVQTSAL